MTDDWSCRLWSKARQFWLTPSLSVLWLGPCSTSLRRSFSYRWWGTHHWFSTWFLRDETTERRQVPFPDQHRCFCSYAPIFSKDCGDKPLASSSSEWVYSQEGHPSLCHRDADSFLPVQAHLAHYARGLRWEEHESVFWVFDHSNLSSGRDRYFRRWASLTDPRSPWHTHSHEV
jgi:hypothetical protein